MKTAEEWAPSLPSTGDGYEFSDEGFQSLVRAIQNDALEAAENAVNGKAYDGAVAAIRALKT